MTEKIKIGCTRPASEAVEELKVGDVQAGNEESENSKEEKHMIRVGKPAPDFSASGYKNGEFINLKLSDFKGQWVVLCFYPGDFTFV